MKGGGEGHCSVDYFLSACFFRLLKGVIIYRTLIYMAGFKLGIVRLGRAAGKVGQFLVKVKSFSKPLEEAIFVMDTTFTVRKTMLLSSIFVLFTVYSDVLDLSAFLALALQSVCTILMAGYLKTSHVF